MSPASSKPIATTDFPRCQHTHANGNRCRLPVPDPNARVCPRHAKLPEHRPDPAGVAPDIAAILTTDLVEFKSAVPINDFLSRLLLLLAQNRISPRRAAVLGFIASQLLRTLPAIDRESDEEDDAPSTTTFIWDIPGPARERTPFSKRETPPAADAAPSSALLVAPQGPE